MSDLLARIDALLDTVGWVPVDQVPDEWKDGRDLWLLLPGNQRGIVGQYDRGHWLADSRIDVVRPTHVMSIKRPAGPDADPTAALLRDVRAALTVERDKVERLEVNGMQAAIDWLQSEMDERRAVIKPQLRQLSKECMELIVEYNALSRVQSYMINRDDEVEARARALPVTGDDAEGSA